MNHDTFAAGRFYEILCAVLDLPVQLTLLVQLEKGRKLDRHEGEATMLQYASQRLLHTLSIETITKPFDIADLEGAADCARVKLLQ